MKPAYLIAGLWMTCVLFIFCDSLSAQVAINTDASNADSSAMLDIKSTIRGVLVPRMSTSQRTDIAAPATGLLVFDISTSTFWFFNGATWVEIGAVVGGGPAAPSVITAAMLTANANNFSPSGFGNATAVRISGDNGMRAITGFDAETNGEEKTLINIGAYPIYLAPEHTGSNAANRIAYIEEVMIPPGLSCRIIYDGVLARWRPLDPPCPNYTNINRSVHYDKSAGKVANNFQDDIHLEVFGSLTQTSAAPTATSPFTSWNFNTGSSTGGGLGLFFVRSAEAMAMVGGAHIVAKMHFKSPAELSDNTNQYYMFLRIADIPFSGFWDQNNSLGLRYRHNINGGKWQCYSRDGSGGETVLDTGIPFEVNTEYEVLVTLNKTNTEATYFLNGAVVGRITANMPAAVNVGPSNHLEKLSGSSARSALIYRFMGAAIAP